ncbi:menaquinone biosynthesis decarboxylase, SCO4490 family [Solidesulfovibrio carbinoliphilus subsp. oakridgensis]|uniref:Menaquinone biosynthesis decarboxylase, SCO4490 family n=1 Tax=Solidesulfovibrio carbinoliphilus subsp. oakridgensis TaxID=694327 RepID=G7Q469_9BACT|nr:menaquinone biosynthesis decarboxylase [Solidesulfovibrio carbinoliphilus]EHJ46859.1 menaquinone biosynthesis decarboxylase, SCO4490 family [Solidesulfovibrio carbinoliphilus subsp. oakridgensis]
MAYKDLQEFLRLLEKKGELRRIKPELSPYLEIAEITDRVSKAVGPALYFENPTGARFPVVTNVFGSYPRMHLSLECENLDALGRRIDDVLEMEKPEGLIEKLKLLPKLAKMAGIFPKTVGGGRCQDVVLTGDDVDLSIMPVLTTWPGDAGPFITLPVVVTRDPVSGKRNVGMYRMQVFDKKTTGMHWHRHKGGAAHYHLAEQRGERLPVAVAIGPDPACTYAATAPLPDDIDEFLFAGFLRQAPVELVQCKTVDLQVPASSQFVLEGYVEPGERRREGPFGDHTGYYSLADDYPVFHVTALTHRKDAVYPATLVGPPPMEDCYMGKATERLFLPLIKKQLPEIVDLSLPLEGVFHNFCFVSIDKRYPGQTRKIMYAIWGLGQMMFTKCIVVVDAGVNVQNTSEVLWRLGNNVDPRRDIVIVDGPLDALDHASPTAFYGGKIGIDATKKGPEEGHMREWPDALAMDPATRARIDALWGELGL